MAAAKRFLRRALRAAGAVPQEVTSDGLPSYPRAIREELGEEVEQHIVTCTENLIEQDHRGIKRRYSSMAGFQTFKSASRFCTTFDEIRAYFRPRARIGERVLLPKRRRLFLNRFSSFQTMAMAN